MRFLVALLIIVAGCISIEAQVPFASYQAVPNYQVNNQGQIVPIGGVDPFESANSQPQEERFAVIGGYYVDSKDKLKRIKIKVNTEGGVFGENVYVRGTYHQNYWLSCNTPATKVETYMDGEYLANNFEWKVYNQSVGYIYFNY